VTRAVAPRTAALRRGLLTVLAGADAPLSTSQVLLGLRDSTGCNSRVDRKECRFGPRCAAWCWHTSAYAQLRALARLGLVEHLPGSEHSGRAHWKHVPAAGAAVTAVAREAG
jgi:hypothetical protein